MNQTLRLSMKRWSPVLTICLLLAGLVGLVATHGERSEFATTGGALGPGSGSQVTTGGGRGGVVSPTTGGDSAETSSSIATDEGGGVVSSGTAWGPEHGPGVYPSPGPGTQCRADGSMPGFHVVSPICLPVFDGDNGGATARGVTAGEVKVVLYYPEPNPAAQAAFSGLNAENSRAQKDNIYEGFRRYLNLHRETYGRQVMIKAIDASGSTAQTGVADAVSIVQNEKPFIVVADVGDTNVAFVEELNARGVPCFCVTSQTREYHERYPDLSFSVLPTAENYYRHIAEYIGKRLNGLPADYAGLPPAGKPAYNDLRRFGLVYLASDFEGTPNPDIDAGIERLESYLARYGARLETKVGYVFDPSQFQQQATNVIAQMLSAEVNNVICLCSVLFPASLTNEASRQAFHPEWMITGYLLSDLVLTSRLYNQDQWRHAFGISPLALIGTEQSRSSEYHMLQHVAPGRDYGVAVTAIFLRIAAVFDGIHYAGPNLNPKTFAEGLYAAPARSNGVRWPYQKFTRDDPNMWVDFAEVWWDATARGPDELGNEGLGLLQRANGGTRYRPGSWPASRPSVFDADPDPISVLEWDVHDDHTADGHTHSSDERCRSCR